MLYGFDHGKVQMGRAGRMGSGKARVGSGKVRLGIWRAQVGSGMRGWDPAFRIHGGGGGGGGGGDGGGGGYG